MSDLSCTCHPDDGPIIPCRQRFAYSECILVVKIDQQATEIAKLRAALAEIADGDAYYDGGRHFMAIARSALEQGGQK